MQQAESPPSSEKSDDDQFTPETAKKIDRYRARLRDYVGAGHITFKVSSRDSMNKTLEKHATFQTQWSVLKKSFTFVIAVFAVYAIIIGLIFPSYFLIGILFAPAVLAFTLFAPPKFGAIKTKIKTVHPGKLRPKIGRNKIRELVSKLKLKFQRKKKVAPPLSSSSAPQTSVSLPEKKFVFLRFRFLESPQFRFLESQSLTLPLALASACVFIYFFRVPLYPYLIAAVGISTICYYTYSRFKVRGPRKDRRLLDISEVERVLQAIKSHKCWNCGKSNMNVLGKLEDSVLRLQCKDCGAENTWKKPKKTS